MIAFVLNAPLLAYNVNKYVSDYNRPLTAGGEREVGVLNVGADWFAFYVFLDLYRVINRNHMFDATEIFRTLSQHKKGKADTV